MTDFTAAQLPAIARRILAEKETGRPVDPHRLQWARDILAWHEARDAAQPEPIAQRQGERTAA